MLNPVDRNRALAPKTVLEVHLIIRAALADAVVERPDHTQCCARRSRTPAAVNTQGRTTFLDRRATTGLSRSGRASVLCRVLGHRQHRPSAKRAPWTAMDRHRLRRRHDVHQSRAGRDRLRGTRIAWQNRNARRRLDLDPTTLAVLAAWRDWQQTEHQAVGVNEPGWIFTDSTGAPIHPHAISQAFERVTRNAGVPTIRLHDVRHTHATLLIKAGIPVKVVSERLGHATPVFTIETYQHVLPGMQAEAARTFQELVTSGSTGPGREKPRRKTA